MLLDGDAFDVRRALRAPGLLRPFNDAGVLAAADVHVARRLPELAGDGQDAVALAVALAVRAPRLGHVFVDLATIRDTATVDREEPVDLSGLPWPDPEAWTAALAGSALVAVGEDDLERRPLRLSGSRLYLDRYWREERRLAADLLAFGASAPDGVDEDVLAAGLARLFEGETAGRQCLAAAAAVLQRLAVVAGGPGTGKTTTVARIVALLADQAAATGAPEPLIALAAPTGKAAARLEEAVHAEARRLPLPPAERDRLLGLEASTLHRLLGRRMGSHSRFRHDRANRLPHDVVVVDETSMVSLSLMARLVEAVRPDARLVLVGDPGQLTSIEAGAVLGDVVGPAAEGLRLTAPMRARAGAVTGTLLSAPEPPPGAHVADGIVVLDRVHRFGGAIARLAEATRRGDADAVVEVLGAGHPEVRWVDADAAGGPEVAAVRAAAVGAGRAVVEAARAGRAARRAGRARALPAAVRAPPRRARRRHLDGARRGLARRRGGALRHGRALVRGAAAAGDGERLRAAAVQRRHRRDRAHGAGPRRSGLRAPRRRRRGQPGAPVGRRHRVRDDRPQEPGLAVRHRGGGAPAADLAGAHPRAALHRGHPRARGADRRRARGGGARRRRPPGRPRERAARAPVGRRVMIAG